MHACTANAPETGHTCNRQFPTIHSEHVTEDGEMWHEVLRQPVNTEGA